MGNATAGRRLADLPQSAVVAKVRQELALPGAAPGDPCVIDLRSISFGSQQGRWQRRRYALEYAQPDGSLREAGALLYERGLSGDAIRAYGAATMFGHTWELWETDAGPETVWFAVDGEPAGSMRGRRLRRAVPRTPIQWLLNCCGVRVWAVCDAAGRRRGLVRLQYPVDKDDPFLFYRTRTREKLLICGARRPARLSWKLEQRLLKVQPPALRGFVADDEDWVLPRETPATDAEGERLLLFLNLTFRVHVLDLGWDSSSG